MGCFYFFALLQGVLDLNQYALRLAGVFAFFFALVGGPIAYQTFDPYSQVGSMHQQCVSSPCTTTPQCGRHRCYNNALCKLFV